MFDRWQDTPSDKPKDTKTRVRQLSEEQKKDLSEMATPQCMEAAERKRQYANMGRAIHKSCNPSLLAKYSLCSDSERLVGWWGQGSYDSNYSVFLPIKWHPKTWYF